MRLLCVLTFVPGLMLAVSGPVAAQTLLQPSELSFSFEIFDPAAPVEHTFYLRNSGLEMVQIERVALTPPLHADKIVSKIPPHQDVELIVSLGTPRQLGDYAGAIEITFKNKDLAPLRLDFTGKITPLIE